MHIGNAGENYMYFRHCTVGLLQCSRLRITNNLEYSLILLIIDHVIDLEFFCHKIRENCSIII